MGPTIILDKSAFQGCSRDEHAERLFRFTECITPVLLAEMLADLAKDKGLRGKNTEESVRVLAKKFLGSGGALCINVRELLCGSLLGYPVPMTGRIPAEGMSLGAETDGSVAALVGMTAANSAIIRWAMGVFNAEEKSTAAALRRVARGFSVAEMMRVLTKADVVIPRPRSLDEIPGIADGLLAHSALQHVFLAWLLDLFPLAPAVHNEIVARWDAAPGYLRDFAPYAFFCTRTLLCFLVGSRSKVLTQRVTNRVDVQYLLYAPFAEVFVSGDRLHHQLYPIISRPEQTLIAGAAFKRDLQRLAQERATMTEQEVARREFAFGSRPWPAQRSPLWSAWERHIGPWKPGSGNRAIRLAADERALAVQEAQELVRRACAE